MLLIEGRDERFVNEVGEQNSLWYRVGVQRRRLRCRKSASFNGFLRRRGRLCFYDIGLREFSGLEVRPSNRHGGAGEHRENEPDLSSVSSCRLCELSTGTLVRRWCV